MCELNYTALEGLGTGLKNNSTLEIIDFSYNGISDKCGGLVAKII
jgi:hypothetical protein